MFHYKLIKKSKLILYKLSTKETDLLSSCNNKFLIWEVNSKIISLYDDINIATNGNYSLRLCTRNVWKLGRTLNDINTQQPVNFNVFLHGNFLQ